MRPVGTASDLNAPELYLNRELSILEFQKRVLAQATDPNTPLLERLRFLTICSTNLDEFFEIRVAGLKQQETFGLSQTASDGRTPSEALGAVSRVAHGIINEQYRALSEDLLPALEKERIRILRRNEWTNKQKNWLRWYFEAEVLPVLTPVGLDPSHPFPQILNKSLNFVVLLDGKDAYGRSAGTAVLQVPRTLPRIIQLPSSNDHSLDVVLLSSVIHDNIGDTFPGMTVKGCYQFRVTRNSELFVDEEEADDLLSALRGELPSRKYGEAVRLEVADDCPASVCEFLLDRFDLEQRDLFQVNGPVNLHRLAALYDLVDRPDLKYKTFIPRVPEGYDQDGNIFTLIRERDLLLHHPFESFLPVMHLLREAARDPNVIAIKQTLYRTDADSPVVAALIDAARAGKEVTAVVELRARFDEAANIDLATRLQQAGANVVYGVVGYKTHAKMLLVVRREGTRLRRYVHLGTGNYHTRTVRAYTDFGLLTCKKQISEDVHRMFLQLTGLGKAKKLGKLLQSPFTLHKTILRLVSTEADEARAGRKAYILAKMNALNDPEIIRALYRASQAGVRIDLIVRGVCCLRPGVKGVSENIRVRSVVGRFLEHARVFHFHAAGQKLTFLSSADWMERNLHRRVEASVPVEDATLRERVLKEGLEQYLTDTKNSWILDADGSYAPAKSGSRSFSAQEALLQG
ncbi:MAG: polyphosphate kinase 1 [Myxococcales bacterium]|nr:polyphosphate kinase 1 [Myxococcales bacterium]